MIKNERECQSINTHALLEGISKQEMSPFETIDVDTFLTYGNIHFLATLPLDKSERMKDEVSGRTFLEATIIEGLKFKTSFNFDLINYNTLDYTNPKLGPAKENGGD